MAGRGGQRARDLSGQAAQLDPATARMIDSIQSGRRVCRVLSGTSVCRSDRHRAAAGRRHRLIGRATGAQAARRDARRWESARLPDDGRPGLQRAYVTTRALLGSTLAYGVVNDTVVIGFSISRSRRSICAERRRHHDRRRLHRRNRWSAGHRKPRLLGRAGNPHCSAEHLAGAGLPGLPRPRWGEPAAHHRGRRGQRVR